jgi:MFS family permease
MAADLHFSEAVYGFGAGVFFIGYLLLEIPGALIVEHWSARRWIARILVSWGICTALVGCVQTAPQFYGARFLLGAAEAGFFPGIIVYLTHWFGTRHGRIFGGGAGGFGVRRAAVGAHTPRGMAAHSFLEMAFHSPGRAGDSVGIRLPFLSHRPASGCEMARSR